MERVDDTTLPMTVAELGFLLDRLGQDCGPMQFVRELTQNAIEAILRTPGGRGDITWDVDDVYLKLSGVPKLCVIDTGDGMNGEGIARNINALSASISRQSNKGNFGVGAKIAAATRNHAGLLYLSWRDGVGSTAHLWRNPDTGMYGLKQLALPGGGYGHWARLDDAVKPAEIGSHGTKVSLLGMQSEENTMLAPLGAPYPSMWIPRYLNTRYFTIPAGITIRARDNYDPGADVNEKTFLRTILGQRAYLERHAESRGSVELADAKAHWWILRDDKALKSVKFAAATGHVAALYQGELYEMVQARAAANRLQAFGVIFGYRRVVIYLEPEDTAVGEVTANTARTDLRINGEPLPWGDWAMEFNSRMPPELVRLIEDAGALTTDDYEQSIRQRLEEIRDLYRLSRYRPVPDSSIHAAGSASGGEAGTARLSHTGNGNTGGKGGADANVYALFLAEDGEPAAEVRGSAYPEVHWVSVVDGSRVSPDIEDRAAKYISARNMLLINSDFRVFADMIDRWTRSYIGTAGSAEVVNRTVREWVQQTLVEVVLGSHTLRNDRLWSAQDLEMALGEEALTAAVLPRYHVEQAVKKSLATKLGSLKERAA